MKTTGANSKQRANKKMSGIPEFHGNPNDLDFNPEYVFNLKSELATANKRIEELEVREKTLIHNATYYVNMTVELEKFMTIIAEKVGCLPDFTIPSTGNQHIYDAIDNLKK